MSARERRATLSLSAVFALRMFGMFSILPVLSIHAHSLPGGSSTFLVGVALGIDGLAQACLQIPFGLLSDRIGRKPVIYGGLVLFALGSFIAAEASSIEIVILGRLVQGMGAIAAAVTALVADLTLEENRAKSMAVIGMSIAGAFAASMVLGPMLEHMIGVSGIFAVTGVLGVLAIAIIRFLVPDPDSQRVHADAETVPAKVGGVIRNLDLLRLNVGMFILHATMRGIFIVVPLILVSTGQLPVAEHWKIYLPIVILSFAAVMPAIVLGESRGQMKAVLAGGVALLLAANGLMAAYMNDFVVVLGALFIYFVTFNLLEAVLPSLVTKIAPVGSRGTAIGVFNTFQFLGLFLGGAFGGYIVQQGGWSAVFLFASGSAALWLIVVLTMRRPPAVRTRMYHVGEMNESRGRELSAALSHLNGVAEAVVIAAEGVAYLKVRLGEWDEAGALKLMAKGV
ncbi:MAG: MFS transporter [Rhodocyclaceae bacterium]